MSDMIERRQETETERLKYMWIYYMCIAHIAYCSDDTETLYCAALVLMYNFDFPNLC